MRGHRISRSKWPKNQWGRKGFAMTGPGNRRVDHCGARHPHLHPHPRRALKVLLIEDNPALRRTLAANLERNGYRVVTAQGGVGGFLGFLRQVDLDLVILDVQLPDMHGLHLLREIRERSQVVPVVLMTGKLAPIYSAIASVSVLRKPFSPAQLLDRIREAVDANLGEGPGELVERELASDDSSHGWSR